MQGFIKITEKISAIARVVVEAAIIALMAVTVADVILRHTVSISILGVTEFSQILMVIIMLATGSTALKDGHIKVDILMNRCTMKVQYLVGIFTSLLAAFISLLMSMRAFAETGRAIREHQTYISLGLVKWPFFGMFAVSMGILAFAAVAVGIKNFHSLTDELKGDGKHE